MCAFFHKIVTLNMGTYMNISHSWRMLNMDDIRNWSGKSRPADDSRWSAVDLHNCHGGKDGKRSSAATSWIQVPVECATYNWASSEALLFVKWMNFRILSSLWTGIRAKKTHHGLWNAGRIVQRFGETLKRPQTTTNVSNIQSLEWSHYWPQLSLWDRPSVSIVSCIDSQGYRHVSSVCWSHHCC